MNAPAPDRADTLMTGRCACGAVKWETAARVLWSGHCHCDSCRRASSAPFTSFFGVQRSQVHWTGDLSPRESSPGTVRAFCPSCGTQMYVQSTRWPTETHLYAATLHDPTQFTPRAHFHWAERVPWISLVDDLPKYAASADASGPMEET